MGPVSGSKAKSCPNWLRFRGARRLCQVGEILPDNARRAIFALAIPEGQKKGAGRPPPGNVNRVWSFAARSLACSPIDQLSGAAIPVAAPDSVARRQLQPEVAPQVLHFIQVPLRTSV